MIRPMVGGRRTACVLTLVAASNAACANTVRSVVLRREVTRETYPVPNPEREELTVRREGSTLVAHVRRTRTQSMMARVTGYDVIQTVNTVPTWATVVGIGGLLAAGLGVLFVSPPTRSDSGATGSTIEANPVLGWSLVGAGAALTLPFIVTYFQAGTTTEQQPFERREAAPGGAPAPIVQPSPGVAVSLLRNGSVLRQGETDAAGEARFDLSRTLPEEAVYGRQRWPTIDITTPSRSRSSFPLAPLHAEVASEAWRDLTLRPTRAALDLFRRRFPDDARLGDLASIEASIAMRERRSTNRDEWAALPASRPAIEAFANREPVDVFVAEARCRLSLMTEGADSRESAVGRCREAVDAVAPGADVLEIEAYRRATQARDDMAIASSSQLAPPLAPLPNERMSATVERPHRGRHRRGRDHTTPVALDIEGRVRQQIAACRDGSRDAAGARRAYSLLLVMRQQGQGNRVGALTVQLNLACGTTPAAVGVNGL